MTDRHIDRHETGQLSDPASGRTAGQLAAERRAGNGDRRRSTLRSLLHGHSRPRRVGPRRARDAGIAAVDWHHPQWLAVGLLIVLLSCGDAIMTLVLMDHGAYEANPLMAVLLDGTAWLFAAAKVALTGAGVIVLVALSRFRAFGAIPVGLILYGVLALYAGLVAYEFVLLEQLLFAA